MLGQLVEAHQRAVGRSSRTIYEQSRIADEFERICGRKKKYGRADIINWLNTQRQNGVCNHTIRLKLQTVKLIYAILDLPFPELNLPKVRDEDIKRPVFTKAQVQEIIRLSRPSCSPEQLCYLAISTTFGLRAIELARLSTEDLIGKLHVNTAKGGPITDHLIPPEIQRFLVPLASRSGSRPEKGFERVFHNICYRAELRFPKGYDWHAIRRALTTELILANARILDVAHFMRWSQRTITYKFGMPGLYFRVPQEIVDTGIFKIHPFLPYWRE